MTEQGRRDELAVTAERCAAQLLGGDPAGSAEEVALGELARRYLAGHGLGRRP